MYSETNMPNKNLEQLQARFNQDPKSDVFYSLACAYIDCGLFEAGAEVLQKGLRFYPDHCKAYAALGMLGYRTGDTDEARYNLQKALGLNPRCVEALSSLAEIEIDAGNIQRAEKCLQQAEKIDSSSGLEKLWRRLEEQRNALLDDQSDDMPFISEAMVDLYIQQNLDEKALAALKQLVVKYPDKINLQQKLDKLKLKLQQKPFGTSTSHENIQQVFNAWLDNIARIKRETSDV